MPAGNKYLINEIAQKTNMITDLINENEQLVHALQACEAQVKAMDELLTDAQQKKLEVLLQDQEGPPA